jgi:RHS repeat-associated protein
MDTGNYLNHEASYNNRLQPVGTDVFVEGGNDNLIRLTYNFVDANGHNNGNVIGISNYYDATRSQQFTYDQLNRIATAETTSTSATSTAHCWGEAYNYDNAVAPAIGEFGNLTSISVASTAYNGCTQESLSLTLNPLNNNRISSFSYDASGNTLNDLTNGCTTGQVCYAWYADGHLAAANGTTYYYDVHGNRVQKAGSKWYWYGLGSDALDESDTSGNITDEYVYFGGERVSHRIVSTNALYFYGKDMLGTSRVVFSSTGTLCYDADFYPFGGERAYTNTCAQNYKFTGKERDAESNLDNFGARYDASSMGRFMSPDPLYLEMHRLTDPQQLNLYSYVRNNPLTLTDPDGMDIAVKCADKANCTTATDQVNARKDGQFKVEIGKDGKWHPVGDVDVSKLSGAEKAFYNALNDTNTHATLTAVSGDGSVFFGLSTGKGTNTVDVADTAQLSSAGLSPGTAVAHEAMEAYATAGGASLSDAHNNDPFPGFTLLGGGGRATVSDGNVTGYQYSLRYNGTGANYQVNTTLKTPIPVASFLNPQTREAAQKSINEQVMSVTPK